MKILLTGASGYIGKRLLPVLIQNGHDVICCVRNLKRFTIPEPLKSSTNIIQVNFLDKDSLKSIPKDFKRIEIPTAAAIFPAEMSEWPPRSYVEKIFNIKQWTNMPSGGHFAALEKPDLLVNDIRKFLRGLKYNPYEG